MKIRHGFVSNSSSTSFTLYGAWLESEDEFLELTGKDLHEFEKESELSWEFGDPNGYERLEYIGLVFAGEFEHCGRSDMRDDETKEEFMQRVEDALPEGIPEERVGWHSESFYNG